jgi:HK97 family phage major capsid protein
MSKENKDSKAKDQDNPKLRWVKLIKEWEGHPAGELIQIQAKKVDDLVTTGLAEETRDPTKKLLKKALANFYDGVTGKISEVADTAIKEALKAVPDTQKRWAPFNLGATMAHQAGTVVDAGGRPGIGPDGMQYGNIAGSGVGMGKWLTALRNASISPVKEFTDILEKEYGSTLANFEGDVRGKATPLAEASGSSGGYTVPIEFAMRLLQLAVQQQIIRPRAFVLPMGARSIRLPMLDVTTAQASGVTAFLGGMQVAWTEEAQSKPEYEPSFKQLELVAHELSAFTLASNQLLADNAIGLDSFLSQLFSRAIGWFSDYAFLQGAGAGKPVGLLNAPATISVNRSAGNTFKVVDAVTMLSKLLTTSMGSAIWVCSQTVIPQLYQLADAAGRNIFLPNVQSFGGLAQSPPSSLLGLPILFTEKLPALGTKGDVMLIDPSYYVIGDRMQLEVQSSIHFKFQNAQTAWRCIARLDGQPWLDSYVTLADATSTVSPFVVLN